MTYCHLYCKRMVFNCFSDLSTMAEILRLQQLAVISVFRVLFSKCDVTSDDFIMQLPLPSQIKDSIADCCAGEVMQNIVKIILACNMHLKPLQHTLQPLLYQFISNMTKSHIEVYRCSLIELFFEILQDCYMW